jgi:hypothetical protein
MQSSICIFAQKDFTMSHKYDTSLEVIHCLQCGAPMIPMTGRQDRKFCCQDCKNRWHNTHRNITRSRCHLRITRILENNNAILRHLLSLGVTSLDRPTLRDMSFNFEYATSYCKLGRRHHYTCFELHYDLTPSRLINLESALEEKVPQM